MKFFTLSAVIALALISGCANKSMDDGKTMDDAQTMDAPATEEKMLNDGVESSHADGAMPGTKMMVTNLLAAVHREAANVARDQYRHPAETLDFFGVKPSDTVVEVTPGGGWYAEILAPLLNDHGSYVAAANDPSKSGSDRAKEYFGKQNDSLRAKFAAHPEVYGRAKLIEIDPKMPSFGAPGSADVVLTFRNVHNWVGGGNADAMFKAFYDALKPGGVLGVVEHRADGVAKFDPKSGYMMSAEVIKLAEAAGFQLEAQSEINANAKDTKDYAGGVWTLPPTLGLGETDKDKYLAIGESDRMTIRFRKPQ
jgi:predicted methyltransferase